MITVRELADLLRSVPEEHQDKGVLSVVNLMVVDPLTFDRLAYVDLVEKKYTYVQLTGTR